MIEQTPLQHTAQVDVTVVTYSYPYVVVTVTICLTMCTICYNEAPNVYVRLVDHLRRWSVSNDYGSTPVRREWCGKTVKVEVTPHG